MDVHIFTGKSYLWRLFLMAELKGIAYKKALNKQASSDSQDIDFEDYFSLSPQQREVSGRENELLLVESMAMIGYLEQYQPLPPVLGVTKKEKDVILDLVVHFDLNVVANLAYHIMTPIILGVTHSSSLQSAVNQAYRDLIWLEQLLQDKIWLKGNRVSAADITAYTIIAPFLRFIHSLQQGDIDMGFAKITKPFPAIERWMQAIKSLRGYRRATDLVWRDKDQFAEDTMPVY